MAHQDTLFVTCLFTGVMAALLHLNAATGTGSQSFSVTSCPEGWKFISAQAGGELTDGRYGCLKLFGKAEIFAKAQAQCRHNNGFLVSVNDVPVTTLRAYAESLQGTRFWTGLHKVINKFYWDNVSPVEITYYPSICPRTVTDYGWGCEGVSEDDCASAKFTNDSTLLEYKSNSCQLRLPYFCYSVYTENYAFIKDPVCGGSWLYNSYDDLSYKLFGNVHVGSHRNAYKTCTAENARLPTANNVNELAVLVGYFSGQDVERVYIGQVKYGAQSLSKPGGSSSCGALKLAKDKAPTIEFVDCSTSLPFICQKSCVNRTASVKLTFSRSTGVLTCTTRSKFPRPSVFWTRNGQFFQLQQLSTNDTSVSIPAQATRASYRCGIFDDLDKARRIWSNVLVADNPQDSTILYRAIMTFNVSYDRGLLPSVYFLQSSTLAPYEWITTFFIGLTRTANASSFGTQLLNISRAPSGALIIYLQLYLRGNAFGITAPAPAAFYPTVAAVVERANKLSPVGVTNVIVRDPFYCFPETLVDPVTKKPVSLPKTLANAWVSDRICQSIRNNICTGNFIVGAYWNNCHESSKASPKDGQCGSGV